jgi:hypothetical protein
MAEAAQLAARNNLRQDATTESEIPIATSDQKRWLFFWKFSEPTRAGERLMVDASTKEDREKAHKC